MTETFESNPSTAANPQAGQSLGVSFSIDGILREGWRLVEGVKLPYLQAFAVVLVGAVIIQGIVGLLSPGPGLVNFILNVMAGTLITTMALGLNLMGIARARGQEVRPSIVLAHVDEAVKILIIAVLVNLIVKVGLILLILPGIYFAVSYAFAQAVAVDKRLGPWEAMEKSRSRVTKQWFSVFGVLVVVGIVTAVTALLIVPLFWTVPWALNSYGILYRALFDEA